MKLRKSIRERGKLNFSRYFQNLKLGDNVAVVRDASIEANFPKRIQGNTGVIESVRGKAYIVKLKDNNQVKRYIIKPIHLKKVK